MLFQPTRIAAQLERLASEHGLFIGTTSWKYPGWCGILYDEDRYLWGNHFSKARFNRNCLEEYARVFKTVCVDATYYRIPGDEFLEDITSRVPGDFRFSFKVPDEITIKTFPDTASFGKTPAACPIPTFSAATSSRWAFFATSKRSATRSAC